MPLTVQQRRLLVLGARIFLILLLFLTCAAFCNLHRRVRDLPRAPTAREALLLPGSGEEGRRFPG